MHSLRSIQESLRHRYLVDILTPYLEGYHRVLDLGAASGLLAGRLARSIPGLRLVGADVLVEPRPHVPMVVGDGKRLPFAEGSLDCVMMVDVLHHDENPQHLLAEAKRIYIVPDRDLALLPFAALPAGGTGNPTSEPRFLGDRLEVAVLPMAGAGMRWTGPRATLLVAGDPLPDRAGEFPRLPLAAEEVEQVRAVWHDRPTTLLTGE